MNLYFYKLWLPLQIITLALLYMLIQQQVQLNWYLILLSWFLIGPIGIGVGYHRFFSHRQFETYRVIEVLLLALGTAAAYSPVIFWSTTHIFHHRNSDSAQDFSSPGNYGFWESFLFWRLREKSLSRISLFNYCGKLLFKDPVVKFFNRHFFKIFWFNVIAFSFLGEFYLLNILILPLQIEHLRVNISGSLTHMKIPLSYRNFNAEDSSYNHPIIGLLTMGFGWHNNHHYDERRLVLTERWWELDVEGLVARLLSRTKNKVSQT